MEIGTIVLYIVLAVSQFMLVFSYLKEQNIKEETFVTKIVFRFIASFAMFAGLFFTVKIVFISIN